MATTRPTTAAKKKLTSKRTVTTKSVSHGRVSPPNNRTLKNQDAIAILRADHTLVNSMFLEYEKTRSLSKKRTLVEKICTELNVHAQVEEEIFYPAVKAALRDKTLIPEAKVEHSTLKDLISQVEGQEPDGEMFDARIMVLSEYVKHHVKEEQNEMFPKAKASKLDMNDLGARILSRKAELRPQAMAKAERSGIVASIKNVIGIAQ